MSELCLIIKENMKNIEKNNGEIKRCLSFMYKNIEDDYIVRKCCEKISRNYERNQELRDDIDRQNEYEKYSDFLKNIDNLTL